MTFVISRRCDYAAQKNKSPPMVEVTVEGDFCSKPVGND